MLIGGDLLFANFQEIFCPTPEQKQKQQEQYQKLLEKAYEEKWCCTCKNYIPVDPRLPGVVTAYPECKLGGIAEETCLFYEVDTN